MEKSNIDSKTIDERFTQIADVVTFIVGKWYFSAISFVILIIWIIYGIFAIPNWFTSPTWNFPVNAVTTLAELWLAFFTLAAANRVERRNQDILEYIKRKTEADLKTTKRVEQAIKEQEQEGEEA